MSQLDLYSAPDPGNSLSFPFAVLDFETTGISPYKDRILEVGIYRWDTERWEAYNTIIDTEEPIDAASAKIHGITEEMLIGKPKLATVLHEILDFTKHCQLVAHNAPFDVLFLTAALVKMNIPLPANGVICTYRLAKGFDKFESRSLAALCDYYGIYLGQAHRALNDAVATAKLFEKLAFEIATRPSLADIQRRSLRKAKLHNFRRYFKLPAQVRSLIPNLEWAISQRLDLDIGYNNRNGDYTERKITPMELEVGFKDAFLTAKCHRNQDERVFLASRMTLLTDLVQQGTLNL